MKKNIFYVLLCMILTIACGKKIEIITLEPDSQAYILGKELSSKLTILDPDSNQILATSKFFKISAGEVLQLIQSSMGDRTAELKNIGILQISQYVNQITSRLAEEKLLLNAAHRANIKTSPAMIDSILNMQYQMSGGEEKFLELLNGYNIDLEFVKNDIKKNVILKDYLDWYIEEKNQVTDDKIQEAYQAFLNDTLVSVRHILLMTQEKSESEKQKIRKRMEKILKQAQRGEDFAKLAKQYTEDPGSKENGGLYENFPRGQMVKSFEDASFSVPVGEISDIVETNYGYHIIKVIGRQKNDAPLEEVRDKLVNKMQNSNRDGLITDHIKELKEKSNFKLTAL